MGANNLGLGLLLEAKDLASGVLGRFGANLTDVVGKTTAAGKQIAAGLKEAGLGLGLFAAGAAGLSLLSPAVASAASFSRAIAEVATETNEATFATTDMNKIALKMGDTFGKMPVEEAKALYKAVAFGANTASSATDLMNSSNTLAVAGVTDVQTAMDGIAGTIRAYGIGFDQAASVSDAFFVAMKSGNTKVGDLAANLGHVSPIAAQLGVSYSDLLAATSTLTGLNIKAEMATSGLAAAFANVMKPAGDAAGEAARLGIQFNAATLRAKGLPGFLDMITHAAGYNADTMSKLFGSIEGVKVMMTLASNGGKNFNDILDAMGKRAGATAAGFAIMENQIQGDRFESLKEHARDAIGEGLLPMRNALLHIANSILDAFNNIPAPVRAFLVQAFAIGSALLAAVGAVIALKGALSIGAAALSAMGVSFGGILATIGPVVGVLALVALGFSAIKAAYDSNFGGFADSVNSAVASVRLAFSALGQLFESGEFSGAVMQDLDKAENSGVKKFAIGVFLVANRIKEFFVSIGEGFSGAMDAVSPAIDGLVASVKPIADTFASLFSGGGPAEAGASFDRWAAAGRAVGAVLAKIAAAVLNVVSLVGSLVSGAVTGFAKLGPTFSGVGDALGELGSVFAEIGNALGLTGDKGISVGEIFFALGRGIAGVFGAALGIIRGLVSGVAGILRGLVSTFSGIVDIVSGIVDGDWSRVWLGMKKVVFGAVQAILGAVGGIVEGIAGAIDAIGSVVGKDLGAANKVKGFRAQLESDTRSFFGLPPEGAPVPVPGGAPAPGGTSAAAAAVAQTERLAAPADQLFATVAALGAQKPPVVNQTNTTIVQIDGEDIPARSTTRTSTASGIPTAPAGV